MIGWQVAILPGSDRAVKAVRLVAPGKQASLCSFLRGDATQRTVLVTTCVCGLSGAAPAEVYQG